jgi:DNA-binding NtrC family response regulator
MKHEILIIDDEQPVLSLFTKFLAGLSYAVTAVPSLAEAREVLARRDFHAVILDQHLSDGKGIELIDEIRSSSPTAAIVMITGQADVPLAVEAMRKGADNFLTKPVQLKELAVFLEKSLEVVSLRRLARTSDLLKKKGPFFFGMSASMGAALEIAQVAVENDGPVLITGETGVGKGVLARWVHESSNRSKGAFVEVNCPSFRGELLRSELYGHARGAFTSAV